MLVRWLAVLFIFVLVGCVSTVSDSSADPVATATPVVIETPLPEVVVAPEPGFLNLPPMPKFSLDLLGAAAYPELAIKHAPVEMGVGIFTAKDTFGDGLPVVRGWVAKGIPLIKMNLMWKDNHSFSRADFPKIVAEARRFVPTFMRNRNVHCHFAGATEHELNARDSMDLAKAVLAVVPNHCIYVNQPYARGAFIAGPRIINEVHGPASGVPRGPYAFSYDGIDAFDSDNTADKIKFKDAVTFYLWTSQFNVRKNRNDKTPRSQRKAVPVPELFEASVFLATDRGDVRLPPRAQTRPPSRIPRTRLVKPKADQHNVPVPEFRALKPVFILPENVPNITLRVGDKVIATSSVSEPFIDGRRRYYFPKYGYQIVRDAKTNVLDLYAGRQKLGTVNPGFRQN